VRRASCVLWVVLAIGLGVAGCGGGDDDYNVPPGDDDGIDAAPLIDGPPGSIDAGPDALGDGDAPTITVVGPAAGALVAGTITLVVDVVDDDGFANDGVTATIGGMTIPMLRAAGGDRWIGNFDTTVLGHVVAPEITVFASDLAGETAHTSRQVILDNEAPLASLDPPNVRAVRETSTGGRQCSVDFDPVGGDAPDDGESVPQLFELRARVADRSNTGTVITTLLIPHAGVAAADLYVLDDTTRPLVVDTDGDGACDDVNPEILGSVTDAAQISLAAIDPAGGAWFGADTFGGSNVAACSAGSDARPAELCFGEPDATIALAAPFTGEAEIYGIPPASTVNCLGFAFDARASNVADGWACAAVVTVDGLGNRNVSPPLRVCIDADGDGAECLPAGQIATPGNRPDCSGTVSGAVVTSTACTPETFARSGTADEFELILQ